MRIKQLQKVAILTLVLSLLQIAGKEVGINLIPNSVAAESNQCNYSANGESWSLKDSTSTNSWSDVTYGNGRYVAISTDGSSRLVTSTDGLSWSSSGLTLPANSQNTAWMSITFSQYSNKFVAVGYATGANPVSMYSSDGLTWTAGAGTLGTNWNDLVFGKNTSVLFSSARFVAVSSNGTNRVISSSNGTTWTERTAAEQNSWQSVTFGNGLFVAVSSDGTNRVMTSSDGTTWTARTAAEQNSWQSVTFGNGIFVAVSSDGTNRVMTSSDGSTWTVKSAADQKAWKTLRFVGGLFIALADNGDSNRIMISGYQSTNSTNGTSVYLSAPYVQGPPSGYNATIETFESLSNPIEYNSFQWNFTDVYNQNFYTSVYGGAVNTSDTPTLGGTRSKYVSISSGSNYSIVFPDPVCYVGLWWPTINAGNTIEFFTPGNSTPVATFTPSTILSLLGSKPSPYPGSGTVRSLDGTLYKKGHYYSSPSELAAGTEDNNRTTQQNQEAWAFVNLFTSGNVAINKVRFSGSGFEPDNLSISKNFQTPTGSMVFAGSVIGKSISFFPNGASGIMPAQTSTSTSAAINSNTFTRTGYTFTGWNTSEDGSGTTYLENSPYNFGAASSDINLYAQWIVTPAVVNSAQPNSNNASTCNSGMKGRIQFVSDSSILTNSEKRKLMNIAKSFEQSGCSTIKIVGYTSQTVSNPTAKNVKTRALLSSQRAKVVEFYLQKNLKVSANYLCEGRSERDAISSNTSENTRKPNRRVEIWFQ